MNPIPFQTPRDLLRYDMKLLFVVPPEAFDPPPKVDSAIVRMIPVVNQLPCDGQTLEEVVQKA